MDTVLFIFPCPFFSVIYTPDPYCPWYSAYDKTTYQPYVPHWKYSQYLRSLGLQTYPRAKTVNQNDINELFAIGNQNFVNQKTHSVINQSAVYYVLDDNGKVTNPLGLVTNKITACMSFILAEKSFIKLIDSFLVDQEITRATNISSSLAEAKYFPFHSPFSTIILC